MTIQLTPRDIAVIEAVAVYYVLNREQIQRLCFPSDENGRITRKRIQGLVGGGFINRHSLFTLHGQAPAPVYYPTRRGAEFLAQHKEDERFLTVNTACPNPNLLYHWLAISETHMALRAAIAAQSEVKLAAWFNEWEVVNKAESRPEKRFLIYTLIQENPRLVCAPDAAFLLEKSDAKKCFFVEQDRSTTAPGQLAAQKTKGYAAMAERLLHRRIFPDALPGFTVLLIAPTLKRLEAVRKEIKGRSGASLWRFVVAAELTPAQFFTGSIVYGVEGDPKPLVKGG